MNKYRANYNNLENKTFAINMAKSLVADLNSYNYDNIGLEETIWYDLEAKMIYDDDRWDLMRLYQRPDEANYNEAFIKCYTEICSIIEEVEEETKHTNNDKKDEVM